jgi:hypothetical protein
MPNVFIPNRGVHDYSSASEYGTLLFLTEGKYDLFAIGRICRDIMPFVATSRPEDILLVSGPTIMNCLLMSMLAVKHNKVNILLYSTNSKGRGQGGYKLRTILFDEVSKGPMSFLEGGDDEKTA